MGNGIAIFVQHVSAAVVADADGCHNVIQEGLVGYKVDNTRNLTALNAVLPKRGGYHNGQFACNLTDRGSGKPRFSCHSLLKILPVGIIVAVKQAVTCGCQQISPLHIVVFSPSIDQGLLF